MFGENFPRQLQLPTVPLIPLKDWPYLHWLEIWSLPCFRNYLYPSLDVFWGNKCRKTMFCKKNYSTVPLCEFSSDRLGPMLRTSKILVILQGENMKKHRKSVPIMVPSSWPSVGHRSWWARCVTCWPTRRDTIAARQATTSQWMAVFFWWIWGFPKLVPPVIIHLCLGFSVLKHPFRVSPF